MPENRITVDEKGNIEVDFFGYAGGACVEEEQRLKRALEELGLRVEVKTSQPKSDAQVQEELNQLRSREQEGGELPL